MPVAKEGRVEGLNFCHSFADGKEARANNLCVSQQQYDRDDDEAERAVLADCERQVQQRGIWQDAFNSCESELEKEISRCYSKCDGGGTRVASG